MTLQHIKTHREQATLVIELNRPEKLNAYTGIMQNELIATLQDADEDDSIRALVVTGSGRAFCAGADLSSGGDTFDSSGRGISVEDYRDGGGQLALPIYRLRKPIIAAINGPAVGIGATMTLPMDIRLASTEARMGFVFSRRGIVPEACSSYFLPRIVGPAQAAEWFFSGRVFDAQEALAGGLVSRILQPGELVEAALSLCREIADNTSPVSVALIRQMMYSGLRAHHPMEAHRIESLGIYHRGRSADVKEGVEAFLAKRPARFPMKVSTDMPDYYPWEEEPPFSLG